MIREYLEERKEILNNIIYKNKEKYDHNQIAIAESYNQIKELDQMVDEASQIFSVKAREDSGFKNQEISDLEKKIAAYVIENKEYEKNINKAQEELLIVENCLLEIKENKHNNLDGTIEIDYVSRETYETKNVKNKNNGVQLDFGSVLNESMDNLNEKEIIQKLEFCKSIAKVDGKRVIIELNNIINMINE